MPAYETSISVSALGSAILSAESAIGTLYQGENFLHRDKSCPQDFYLDKPRSQYTQAVRSENVCGVCARVEGNLASNVEIATRLYKSAVFYMSKKNSFFSRRSLARFQAALSAAEDELWLDISLGDITLAFTREAQELLA